MVTARQTCLAPVALPVPAGRSTDKKSFASAAQWIEQVGSNDKVGGSTPFGGAKRI